MRTEHGIFTQILHFMKQSHNMRHLGTRFSYRENLIDFDNLVGDLISGKSCVKTDSTEFKILYFIVATNFLFVCWTAPAHLIAF